MKKLLNLLKILFYYVWHIFQDSVSSIARVSTNSSSMENESILYDDSYARLTEDVVRKMSYEEKSRANHELAVFIYKEKTLVENARAQMALLESIKK